MGTDRQRGIPVEVQGRWFLVLEVPGGLAGGPPPEDLALRLLIDRVDALARELERTERERDALTAEAARLRARPASAAVRAEVARSWDVPRALRARRETTPSGPRWLRWRR